jgi:hypothetical protein
MAQNPELDGQESKAKAKPQPQMTDAEVTHIRENTAKLLSKQPKRTIKIRKESNPKAPNYETVQINGYTYMIKKGEEVEVPEEVYNILNRAGLY